MRIKRKQEKNQNNRNRLRKVPNNRLAIPNFPNNEFCVYEMSNGTRVVITENNKSKEISLSNFKIGQVPQADIDYALDYFGFDITKPIETSDSPTIMNGREYSKPHYKQIKNNEV